MAPLLGSALLMGIAALAAQVHRHGLCCIPGSLTAFARDANRPSGGSFVYVYSNAGVNYFGVSAVPIFLFSVGRYLFFTVIDCDTGLCCR